MKLSDLDIRSGGKQVKCHCPLCHDERNNKTDKSMSVNTESGLYKCHYCGAKGILEDYKASLPIDDGKTYSLPPLNTTGLGDDQQTWLVSRGITISVANRNKITQSPKGWLEFNYYEGSTLVNIKYRSIRDKKFMQHKGGKPVLYGLNDIAGEEEVIICEGEMDKLSIEVAGFTNCASVPLGAINPNDTNVEGKLKCFEFATPYLEYAKTIIIATDNDKNGHRLRDEIARRFGKSMCRWVDWGEYKDSNEVLVNDGPEKLKSLILSAKEFPIEGVATVSDYLQQIHDLYIHGAPESFDVGLGFDFDRLYRVAPGFLTIITGAPTSGKSNFIENIAMNMMRMHGWKVAAYTPEHPEELEVQRLSRMYTGKFFFDGNSERMSQAELVEAVRFLNDHFYFIKHKMNNTIERIIESLKQVVLKYGINAALIDPWTDVDHNLNGMNETMYVGQSLAMLKDFCRTYNVHTWLIAHPSKPRKDKNGDYIKPTLYDVSGSANFYNKADMGMIVHREEKIVKVEIKKVKFEGIHGTQGEACFAYDYPSCTYTPTIDPDIDTRF